MTLWSTLLLRPSLGRSGVCSGTVRRAFLTSSSRPHSQKSATSVSSITFSFSPLAPLSHSTYLLRHTSRRLLNLRISSLVFPRFASTAKAIPKRSPERLLVFHAGTPRTTFLACLKVTTLFGLAFFTFLVAPAYVAAGKPLWQVLGIMVCGIVPFAIVAYTTSPFVVFIHLRLPAYARHPDRELLRRFVRNIPPSTKLDVTTMNLVGRPRLTSVAVGDLVPTRERLRIVNFVDTQQSSPLPAPSPVTGSATPRSAPSAAAPVSTPARPPLFTTSSKFPWVHLRPTTHFGAPLAGNSRGVKDAWAWDYLLATIERQAVQPSKSTTP